jgi:hypothetical protein
MFYIAIQKFKKKKWKLANQNGKLHFQFIKLEFKFVNNKDAKQK